MKGFSKSFLNKFITFAVRTLYILCRYIRESYNLSNTPDTNKHFLRNGMNDQRFIIRFK